MNELFQDIWLKFPSETKLAVVNVVECKKTKGTRILLVLQRKTYRKPLCSFENK